MKNNQRYFNWLVGLLGEAGPHYSSLLSIAHDVLFYEIVENDINRVNDGLSLRDKYVESTGNTRPIIVSQNPSCTVLELLIGLTERLDDIDYDPRDPNRTAHWFWILIDNLNLLDFSDKNINEHQRDAIEGAFIRLVERDYEPNGVGGLFPLTNPENDQTNLEIWYQMQAWAMTFVY